MSSWGWFEWGMMTVAFELGLMAGIFIIALMRANDE